MTATAVSPALVLTAVVRHVERLSPSFVRIRFGGQGFEDVGPEGPTLDQRIKLVIPTRGHEAPRLDPAGWYAAWLALPEAERGFVRTYTARAIVGEGEHRQLVVDFVLHGAEAHGGGAPGPAGTWAAEASVGDEICLVAPRRGHEHDFGGIEFAPADARRLVLVADEAALPALASIAEDLPAGADGLAVVEVPGHDDLLDVRFPPGVVAHWVTRGDRPRGAQTVAMLRACLRLEPDRRPAGVLSAPGRAADLDDDVWETATYSSSGDDVAGSLADASHLGPGDTYAWVAGDSDTVKACRRLLLGEAGLPRHQVAFMGYWKQGRAQ